MYFRRLLSITLLPFLAISVFGHAILVTVKPLIGESVHGPDVEVSLQFNSRVDAKRSTLTLVAPDGGIHPLSVEEQASPDSLNSRARGLKSGPYTLRWQVLAADGHISRGEVPFKVE